MNSLLSNSWLDLDNGNVRLACGDALTVLKTLPDESVNCCVTSPPFWGLRDYGTATWEGGDAECDHLVGKLASAKSTLPDGAGCSEIEKVRVGGMPYRDVCGKCGAHRIDAQLGLESTPDAYVAALVSVFREVRRVLRKDGTVWLNLGDTYASSGGKDATGSSDGQTGRSDSPRTRPHCLPAKNLCGIPWRVAFALQADGWWLRQDIIWHKPNPMPESVTDRCTKAHEYIFLLTKSARYFYDARAVAEATVCDRMRGPAEHPCDDTNGNEGLCRRPLSRTRNRRSVWVVTPKPYKEAHFATYPPDLIRPCIRAGCPVGGLVLDPFAGSGTTGQVCVEEGRRFVGIELNPGYIKLVESRIANAKRQVTPLLPPRHRPRNKTR